MSFTDFITSHGKKVTKDAFVHLVQVSKSDGIIQKDEFELLHKEGKRFGLTDPEIDKLIQTEPAHSYHPPYSLDEKFEQLLQTAEMILADDIVTEGERKMIKKFAIAAGFRYEVIDDLIDLLIEGVRKNTGEEELLGKFKKVLLG